VNTKRIVIYSLLAVTLASCGGTTQPQATIVSLSAAEIGQAEDSAKLLKELQSANAQLINKSESSYAEDYARRAKLEDRLVALAIAKLDTDFAEQREDSGVVPSPAIVNIAAKVDGGNDIPAEKWQQVQERVALETTRTEDYVKFEASKMNQSISDQQTLNLLEELYRLSGDNQWLIKKNDFLDKLLAEIRKARAEGRYDAEIQTKVALVRQERGNMPQLADELASYDAKAYENAFLLALGEADLDKAYGVFTTMAESPDFKLIADKLAGTSQTMAAYFLAKADQAVLDTKRLDRSAKLYYQARDMNQRFELTPIAKSNFKALIDQLARKYKERSEAHDYEAALAFLLMIGDFDKSNTLYQSEVGNTKVRVRDLAVKKLLPSALQSSPETEQYGGEFVALVGQYLSERVPDDVRILQNPAAVSDSSRSEESDSASAAADYLLTGNLLKAEVDSTEIQGRKLTRVVVGHETISNPALKDWLALSDKERSKVEQPEAKVTVPKHENISIGVTEYRKVGVVSVGYRLQEAASGKVIFPDSIDKKAEFKDNSVEGVDIGEYVQPFKPAKLPSDDEILDGLVKELALEASEKLIGLLSHQEEKYLAAAEASAQAKNCAEQVRALGRAAAMLETKKQDYKPTWEQMKQAAIGCKY